MISKSEYGPSRFEGEQYLDALRKYGIMGGYADGTFRPNNKLTRIELYAVLYNVLQKNSEQELTEMLKDLN
ncbi:S-layer homology domain-containing protein [Criibacterium bergeronii]|uniref:S-layer homology domain-containing protein n=1 Tax=Criibacterium bergeronii TaxID=1871336 RepID=A0A552VBF6_9FIRM|nr:S-layer homology domain-containing protein [Criibacterium bergeronii]TRW27808.1 S-layer homology domain-containing protein [Criibacterium bergeronii]